MSTNGRRAPVLGILLLEGKMAQVSGCMAGERTFPYPVLRRVVPGSRPPTSAEEAEALLPLYAGAARELEREGADVITDNCNGLLALLQERLAATVRVPVITSALSAVPALHRMLPGRRIGILAFHRDAVHEEVCNACGWSLGEVPTVVGEVGGSPAWQEFLRTKAIPPPLRERLEADLIAIARSMLAEAPDLGAFVSECTLLPPCLEALREAVGLPVWDILTLLDLAVTGCRRPADAAAALC